MAGENLVAPNVSRAEFARSLSESGLFDSADLLPVSGPVGAGDGAAAAGELVVAGKLTAYQAAALLHRRFADLRIGNYEILDRIGAGGMGTVFKARHRRMKRIVALKVLSKEVAGAGKFAERFQREVETIARLTHPNIVMAFDADEGETGPFLVMEFVNGRDLASEVEKTGPLSVPDAVDCVLQAARGLEYASARGIVHRDIKPSNILRDADGVVKVADLGLARLNSPDGGAAVNTSLTQAGTVFGTADYMSPEQAVDSAAVDQRADIYSLGCTLYFLLAGAPPYRAGSILALLLKHRDAPIPPLAAARPEVPPDVDSLYRRMVAKLPEQRQQSMAEVVADLERLRAKLPPGSPRTPAGGPQPTPAANRYDRTAVIDSPDAARSLDTAGFELGSVPGTDAGGVGPATGLTVVIAETSRVQAGIIRQYLRQLGIEAAHTATSGREAIETAKRVGANLLISSLHLTDMDGVQLAVAVRGEPGCAGIGFILATSETESDLAAGLPHDARTVVMPKPFDPERLAQSIARATG